jgi:transcription elongation factor GreA
MSDKQNYLTQEAYYTLKDELDQLKKKKRPEIAERIKQAKDYGDLSENAEYADAREEQSFTEGRILELETVLKNVTVVSNGNSDPDMVQIGDTITVEKDGGKSEYTIVGSNEANPTAGKISNESPIGKSLVGKKKGEEATVQTPKGESVWKIVDIKAS